MKLKLRGLALTKLRWQSYAFFIILMAVIGGLLWWQLGTLTAGYSAAELKSLEASLSLKHILEYPLNAPFHIVATALYRILDDGLLAMRLTAALFGIGTVGIFYWLVTFWHGQRSALYGTLLFGSSAWFLHTARFGTPDVLLFLLLALIGCAVWMRHSKSSLPLLIGFALATALIYIPGMIWFIIIGVLWQWKRIDRLFKKHLAAVSIGAIVVFAALAPLAWAIYKTPTLGKQILGLPAIGWPDPLPTLRAIVEVPLNLFWRGPLDPAHWLGRLPLLDVFTLAMAGLGAYLYLRNIQLSRVLLMAIVLLLGILLIGLGGGISLSIIIPFVYILAAAGIGLMLDYWYQVFPRNIIARATGTVLLSFAVLVAGWYNLRHYFIAWPNAPETKTVFIMHDDTVHKPHVQK